MDALFKILTVLHSHVWFEFNTLVLSDPYQRPRLANGMSKAFTCCPLKAVASVSYAGPRAPSGTFAGRRSFDIEINGSGSFRGAPG